MFKRIITKVSNALKPKQWVRDKSVPPKTGKSIKEILDNDPHKDLEILIRKIKTGKEKGTYVDTSVRRLKGQVDESNAYDSGVEHPDFNNQKDIMIHTHPNDHPIPSPVDLMEDIYRYELIDIYKKDKNKPASLPMTVISVKDSKTHEEIGRTYYTIPKFKDKNGNLTNDPKYALEKFKQLLNPNSFSNFKWAVGSLAQGKTHDYNAIKKYLDIHFKFIPAKGYRFNKKKIRFEKIK
ncbi:MAG TPA: hypothetical protein PK685_02975 [archaeon]|nr:hypothetical protein [archaeon]